MLDRMIKFITSLRLTVVLLALGIVLVFLGTVAQADEGLYQAQERYFKHWFVPWFSFLGHKVPLPLPGGYLLGTLLLVNLVAAHIKRFQWTWKKAGIHLTHLGVILLLVGQLTTDIFSRETQMSFSEGETRDYTTSPRLCELAFATDAGKELEVVAIPDNLLVEGREIKHEKLPFTIRVKKFLVNSNVRVRAPMVDKDPPPATAGMGADVTLIPLPETHKMDARNLPAVVLELVGAQGSLGTWLGQPLMRDQEVPVGDKTWSMAFRFERDAHPFSMQLLKTTHEVYPGTEIPKNFQSRVRIQNPAQGEKREVDIYMNNPLRYAGLTFYQSQMGRDELDQNRGSSVLQVVRNPSWLTPYFGCGIVAAGLVVQFMIHLVGFISRKARA